MGNSKLVCVNEHKHLGMTLDSQLNFHSHIRAIHVMVIHKAGRGIGLYGTFPIMCLETFLKSLSPYLG